MSQLSEGVGIKTKLEIACFNYDASPQHTLVTLRRGRQRYRFFLNSEEKTTVKFAPFSSVHLCTMYKYMNMTIYVINQCSCCRINNSGGFELFFFRKHQDEMTPRVSWRFDGEKNQVAFDDVNLMDDRKFEHHTWKLNMMSEIKVVLTCNI